MAARKARATTQGTLDVTAFRFVDEGDGDYSIEFQSESGDRLRLSWIDVRGYFSEEFHKRFPDERPSPRITDDWVTV